MHKQVHLPHDLGLVRRLISKAGRDPQEPHVLETPQRFLDAWQFWNSGHAQDGLAVLKSFEHTNSYGCMVFQANIPTYSTCEHHLAPFFGVTHIGYIPNGRVVGLSKLARLVDVYARRLQIQERICEQVADTLFAALEPKGVGVMLQMRHLCLESRGAQKPGTITITSTLRGAMLDDSATRAEFLAMVNTAAQGVRSV